MEYKDYKQIGDIKVCLSTSRNMSANDVAERIMQSKSSIRITITCKHN